MARPGLDRNVKFRNLCRILGEPRPHVRGYLELLWEVAYENGDPVIGDASTVEAAAEYPGEPGKLFAALMKCGGVNRAGFIEPVPGVDGFYQVHDLYDHAPEYVSRRKEMEDERKKDKRCEHCGKTYRSPQTRSRYCSDGCRTAAWRNARVTTCNDLKRTETEGTVTETTCNVTVTDVYGTHAHSTQHTSKNPPTPLADETEKPLQAVTAVADDGPVVLRADESKPLPYPKSIGDIANEWITFYRGTTRNERDPYIVGAAFGEWVRSGAVTEAALRAEVRSKKRDRSEPTWQMKDRLLKSRQTVPKSEPNPVYEANKRRIEEAERIAREKSTCKQTVTQTDSRS